MSLVIDGINIDRKDFISFLKNNKQIKKQKSENNKKLYRDKKIAHNITLRDKFIKLFDTTPEFAEIMDKYDITVSVNKYKTFVVDGMLEVFFKEKN
jgi:hypothetical protein